ncbi:relaxase/mobilization nuclease domain-containing protein [Ruminococcus sp. Marseille-P6503]|uniref:relaxase/mobilization nuclease domain-containing protein n=1 Tax=Ruminococcus sp. Marseille-P6503 TaxID=2364796 RepID=UPI000F5217BA|nr:relaxase/mobilization nuclease domain-containing protein [Ruminococcus sp. Marseille-P6503]
MAATKIISIRFTEANAIAYIANPEKTDNGRLVYTFGCRKNPYEASRDFEQVRSTGTGRNQILSHHFMQSFSPGEITPEKALQVGIELCRKFLNDEYQYYLAVHTDKDHIHLHCIFNNVNMVDGLTFETHADQGDKRHRKWVNLRNLSDEICKKHKLSVIENPEMGKGKSYFEWDMNRQNLSWKAKLKFAIDQVIKESEDFDDFLLKCKAHNIEVVYNPEHVIDLKFRLAGQQRFTRARTLGWYYESKQIPRRIAMYKGVMNYTPKTNIIRTDTEKMQGSYGLRKWEDLQNMKEASRVINILTKYGVENNVHLENTALADYARMGALSENLNSLNTQIEDLSVKIKTARKVQKLKPIIDELKALSGRRKDKLECEHKAEFLAYHNAVKQLKEWFPDGRFPSPENLDKKRNALIQERSEKNEEYKTLKAAVSELNYARQALSDYLRNERNAQEQKRRKEDLE